MALIVAARFPTFMDAENAANTLFANSFRRQDVSIFFVSPPGQNNAYPGGGDEFADQGARPGHRTALIGAALGGATGAGGGIALMSVAPDIPAVVVAIAAGIGAYVGSLIGALSGMRDGQKEARPGKDIGVRRSGVQVAVNADPDSELLASRLLKQCGGKDIERAIGTWRDGRWVDFDPVHAPVLSDKIPPAMA